MDSQKYAVEMIDIVKTFTGIVACDNISIAFKPGEVHALLGENGAGKSTLMSVLFGMYRPESGIIKIKGKEVNITGPREANSFGIGMVHQHFKLVDCFTVLQNIILGDEPLKKSGIDYEKAREKIKKILL